MPASKPFKYFCTKLKERFPHLTLIKLFTGKSTGPCIVEDSDFGIFYAKRYFQVYLGEKLHPERTRINKTIANRNPDKINQILKTKSLYTEEQKASILEKSKQTYKNKTGYENSLQNPEVKAKRKKVFLEKTGYDEPLKCPEIRRKGKETLLKKYNTSIPLHNSEIKEKARQSKIKNKSTKYIVNGDSLHNELKTKNYRYSYATYKTLIKSVGVKKALNTKFISKRNLERIIESFLIERNINDYIIDKKIFVEASARPDIYLPNYNLIIECDSFKYHSDKFIDKDYHINRRKLYDRHSINYLFFYQDELLYQPNIVKSLLLIELNIIQKQLLGKDFLIMPISPIKGKKFLEKNFLPTCFEDSLNYLGLYYQKQLLSVLSYEQTEEFSLKIINYCQKINHNYNCFEKFVNYMKEEINPYLTITLDLRFQKPKNLPSEFSEKTEIHNFLWTDYKKISFKPEFKKCRKIWSYGQKVYSNF